MMSNRYLLRVEAVNLGSFIEDSFDLSTIRGGGLLLLDATGDLREDQRLEVLYEGASSALCLFEATDDEEAERIRESIEARLHEGGRAEATILTAAGAFAEGGDVAAAARKLQNKIRRRQLRSPTVVYPEPIYADGRGAAIDEVDDVRPARERPGFRKPKKEGETRGGLWVLSEATYARRTYGT